MRNSDIFLDRIHSIESILREATTSSDEVPFSRLIDKASEKNALIRQNAYRLKTFGKLRNAIQHGTGFGAEKIAEPHESIVREITEIERKLRFPKRMEFFFKSVSYLSVTDTMSTMLMRINELEYSQFPVFDEDGRFVALVTESGITNWLAHKVEEDIISFEEIKIKEIMKHDERSYTYRFIARTENIFEAKEYFIRAASKGEKLEALLITENGKSTERLLGIVTHWDLVEFR